MLTFKHYDDAVTDYFKRIYEWTVFSSPDSAFHTAGLNFGDKVPLPLISLYRSEFALNPSRNTALFFRGRTLNVTETKINKERILPLLFSYQVDFWGDHEAQLSQMLSEVLFCTIEDPIIKLNMDGFDKPYEANMVLQEVQNNSESIQFSSRGRLYRFTATFQIQAYIAKLEERERAYVVPTFYTYDGKRLE